MRNIFDLSELNERELKRLIQEAKFALNESKLEEALDPSLKRVLKKVISNSAEDVSSAYVSDAIKAIVDSGIDIVYADVRDIHKLLVMSIGPFHAGTVSSEIAAAMKDYQV